MPRGGRRAGAGAPVGNFNRLSTGRRSTQLEALTMAMARRRDVARLVYRLAGFCLATHPHPTFFPRRGAGRPRKRSISPQPRNGA